jgi:hypothetical protein
MIGLNDYSRGVPSMVSVGNISDGYVVPDIECLDRIYLNSP